MPTYPYDSEPRPLSKEELDALAAEQAAMGGVAPPGGYQSAAGQTIAFAPTLRDETTEERAPWTEHAEPTYVMLRTEHHFRGVTGTGRPLTVRVALRSNAGPAASADGVLTALAIAELPPLTVIPGCGPLVTLAGGPFPG